MEPLELTKYERARIIGARALQVAMNAPLLIKIEQEDLERINFDALKIAEIELSSGILPISVKKPFPDKKEEKLKRAKKTNLTEEEKIKLEEQEEEDVEEEGEIMQLANPEDESEGSEDAGSDEE